MIWPKALIFDVDGTLADNERDGHRVAFNQAFAAAGLDWHWSESFYGSLLEVGGGKERIAHYIDQEIIKRNAQAVTAELGEALGTAAGLQRFIQALHQSKTQLYRQHLAEGNIPLRPGVLRLLTEARRAGVRLAIATTSALPSALALLEQALPPGGTDWFEVIAAGDMVSHKKPAPDIYNYVLEQLGLEASDCLVFEDSPVGLQAALAAGLPTVVTVNGYTQGKDFAGANLVLSHLGEPDQPFEVIAGTLKPPAEQAWVNLAWLASAIAQPVPQQPAASKIAAFASSPRHAATAEHAEVLEPGRLEKSSATTPKPSAAKASTAH